MENKDIKILLFKGHNQVAYTKIIVGIILLIFMLIMTPLLASKYIIDMGFILYVGVNFLTGAGLIYSGYHSRDKNILAVSKEHFEYINNNLLTNIHYAKVKNMDDRNGKFLITYEDAGKEKVYEFKDKFLAKEVRSNAKAIIKKSYEEYKKSHATI